MAAGLATSAAGAFFFFFRREGELLEVAGLGALALLFAVGIVEGLTARVILGVDSIEIVTNFRRTAVPRRDLVRAVGEKGAPVAVEHRAGGWLKLPRLGTGPHANTVRAWINRREGPEAPGAHSVP